MEVGLLTRPLRRDCLRKGAVPESACGGYTVFRDSPRSGTVPPASSKRPLGGYFNSTVAPAFRARRSQTEVWHRITSSSKRPLGGYFNSTVAPASSSWPL